MLGIVILNYNTYKKTIECVKSILKTYDKSCQIFIVDNASKNDSYKILEQMFKSNDYIEIIKAESNGGFSRGNNIGIKAAQDKGCKYAIISNNDIIFLEKSIESLFNFIRNQDDAVIVGPKILKPNMKVQHSTVLHERTYFEYLGLRKIFFIKKNIKVLDEEEINIAKKVYSISGCCFIIDVNRFKSIGSFDEGTFLYNEENIFSLQIKRSPYSIYFYPISRVVHIHGATAGKVSMFINREFLKSGLYYWSKYRKINSLLLVIMWINFTLRWVIKSLYNKDLRSGWKEYFVETLFVLKREILRNRN